MRHRRHLVAFEDEVRAALEEAADLGGALRAARAVLVRDDVVREDVRLALAVVGEGVGVELLPADGDVLDLAVDYLQTGPDRGPRKISTATPTKSPTARRRSKPPEPPSSPDVPLILPLLHSWGSKWMFE